MKISYILESDHYKLTREITHGEPSFTLGLRNVGPTTATQISHNSLDALLRVAQEPVDLIKGAMEIERKGSISL